MFIGDGGLLLMKPTLPEAGTAAISCVVGRP
jgi:hypothetical protein